MNSKLVNSSNSHLISTPNVLSNTTNEQLNIPKLNLNKINNIGSIVPPSSPSSKRACKLFKEFCNRYIHLHTVNLKLTSSAELISISEALKQRHYINHLNLSHNKSIKDLESWIAFSLALKTPTQTLVQLDLSHNYLAPEGLGPIIADIIKSNKSIQWLNLSHNNLDQDEDHSILESLKYNQHLTHLDISWNEYQLSTDVSKHLCSYLERTKTLTSLNFSYNSTRYPLHGLSHALKANQSLKQLDLSCMVISSQDSLDFIKTVISSSHLCNINLYQCFMNGNPITYGPHITHSLAKRYFDYDNLLIEDHVKNSLDDDSDESISSEYSSSDSTSEFEFYLSCPLIYLNIGGLNFGKKAFNGFLNILLANQDLMTLDLSSTQLSEASGSLIAEFLKLNRSIQHLNLSNNDFYEKSVDIAEALQYNHSLISLNLSNLKSSNLIGKVLSKSLSINRTLKKLNLSHTKLSSSGVLELSIGLGENRIQLQSLNLDDTDLGERGAILIGESLRTNRHLEYLYLNFNSIQRKGAKSIGKSLKFNQSLKTIQLGYNQIGAKGVKSLCKYFKSNCSLRELSLKNNLLPEKAGISIVDALKSNQSLEILNLRGNLMGIKFANSVCKLLQSNQTLLHLDLSHNHLSKEVIHKIYQSLKKKFNSNSNFNLSTSDSTDNLFFDISPKSLESMHNMFNSSSVNTSSSSLNNSLNNTPKSPTAINNPLIHGQHQHQNSESCLKLINPAISNSNDSLRKSINSNSLPSRKEISPYQQSQPPKVQAQIPIYNNSPNSNGKRNSLTLSSSPVPPTININVNNPINLPSSSLPYSSPLNVSGGHHSSSSTTSKSNLIFLKDNHNHLFERIDQ